MRLRYEADRYPELPADGGGGDYLTDRQTYEVFEVHPSGKLSSFRTVPDDSIPALFDARGFVGVIAETAGGHVVPAEARQA